MIDYIKSAFLDALGSVSGKELVSRALNFKGEELLITDRNRCKSIVPIHGYRDVKVIAVGKAAASMAEGLDNAIGSKIDEGLVITKHGFGEVHHPYKTILAAHPVPDESSLSAYEELESLVTGINEEGLLFLLLSGGASSLMCSPAGGVPFSEKREMIRRLLLHGASINELNTVRRHLSRGKGGNLLRKFSGKRVVAIALSDVLGDAHEDIASGPVSPDPSTFFDAMKVLETYKIDMKYYPGIRSYWDLGMDGCVPETVKPDDPLLNKQQYSILANNRDFVTALENRLKQKFNPVHSYTYPMTGEATVAAIHFSDEMKKLKQQSEEYALIAGGETTVTVRGNGKGGRNTELCLAMARQLFGLPGFGVLCAASDGNDGITDAAGAWFNTDTLSKVTTIDEIDHYLHNNDSYTFFEKYDCLIKTGITNTNLNDVAVGWGESEFQL